MLMGGVAAYWGDHVGMLVGRKRLTIMGLRPKHTSRVVAIGTGVLIVLFTLSTLLIVSNSVRQALFGMEELQTRVVELSAEVHAFEEKRIELEDRNLALTMRSQELEAETRMLELEKAGLSAEVRALEEQVSEAKHELSRAREQLASLEQNLEFVRFVGAQSWNLAQTLFEAEFVVHVGDVVGAFVVDLTQGSEVAKESLQEGLLEAERALLARGFAPVSGGPVVRLDRSYSLDGEVVTFSGDEVLDQAVATLMEWAREGLQSVIVRLQAATNARVEDEVYVDFGFVIDQIIFRQGELLASQVFDPTLPKGRLLEEVMAFLQFEIGGIARANLLPLDGDYGQVTLSEAYEAVDRIARFSSPVTMKVTAAKDVWAHESLSVAFSFEG